MTELKPTIITNAGPLAMPIDFKDLDPLFELKKPICPTLGQVENHLITIAKNYPAAIDCDKKKFVNELKTILLKCFKDTGFAISKMQNATPQEQAQSEQTEIMSLAITVADDILREIPHATIPELQHAFHKGVRNELLPPGEQFYGLSAVTFYRFAKYYFNNNVNEARRAAFEKQLQFEAQNEQAQREWKPTKAEKDVITFLGLVQLINTVDKDDDLFLYHNSYNDLFLKWGTIQIAPEATQKAYFEFAEKNLTNKKRIEIKLATDTIKKKHLGEVLEQIKKGQHTDATHKEATRLYVRDELKKYIETHKNKKLPKDEQWADAAKQVKKIFREKLLGKITNDELYWDCLRLRLRTPQDFFKTRNQYEAFLKRTEALRKTKLPRP